MLKRLVVMFLGLFVLSGCTDGFRGYHKKSANNKLIDSKGFQGGKHPPLYNKKYVKMAKKNVIEENFDDDDELVSENDTETINPALRNRQMYLQMVKQDADRVKKQKIGSGKDSSNTLGSASAKINKEDFAKDEAKIAKELEQIKLMLKETKKDLERYRCSAQKNLDTAPVITDDKISSTKLPVSNSVQKSSKGASTKTKMNKKFLSEDFDHHNISTDNNVEEDINPRAL
jgi:asparagine synthetase B (glutamine-hydrolysing)